MAAAAYPRESKSTRMLDSAGVGRAREGYAVRNSEQELGGDGVRIGVFFFFANVVVGCKVSAGCSV